VADFERGRGRCRLVLKRAGSELQAEASPLTGCCTQVLPRTKEKKGKEPKGRKV